jgi:hypothetical protein
MAWTGSAAVIKARMRMSPPQSGQARGDEAMRAHQEAWCAAEYLRTARAIDVPALVLQDEAEIPEADLWKSHLQAVEWVASGEMSVADPAIRAYFMNLPSDAEAQAELRAVYRDEYDDVCARRFCVTPRIWPVRSVGATADRLPLRPSCVHRIFQSAAPA